MGIIIEDLTEIELDKYLDTGATSKELNEHILKIFGRYEGDYSDKASDARKMCIIARFLLDWHSSKFGLTV